jgi:formylglycine-generating enzyme required for sulfatase activity
MPEIDPTQSAMRRRWARSLAKPWLVAGILVLLAIGHGRFEFTRWSAMEDARRMASVNRQGEAASALAKAVKRSGGANTQGRVQAEAEAPKGPTSIELLTPVLHPVTASSIELPAAVVPALPCDGVDAQVGLEHRCLRPMDIFKDCSECPEMVVVAGGAVMMGSPSHEEGRASNEGPQHEVKIEKQFAAGKFETTFEEWNACMLAGACKHAPNDHGWGKGRRPVVDVSWEDAKEYVTWLSKKTGMEYRLLREAEWEYAARAGTTSTFSTGQAITGNDANFDAGYSFAGSGKGQYRKSTVEVGSFRPNAFGLHDMHGNVWEWVEDCWHSNYRGGPANGTSWSDRCNERARVLRGGSWIDPPRILRSAYRSRNIPVYRSSTVGFRVARTLE